MPSENLGEYLTEILNGKFFRGGEDPVLTPDFVTQYHLSDFTHNLWCFRTNLSLYVRVLEAVLEKDLPRPLPTLDEVSLDRIILPSEVNLLKQVSWVDLEKALKKYQQKLNGITLSGIYVGENNSLYSVKLEISPESFRYCFREPEEISDEVERQEPQRNFSLLDYKLVGRGSPLEIPYTYVDGPYTLAERGEVNECIEAIEQPPDLHQNKISDSMINWIELLILLNKSKERLNHFFLVGNRQGFDSHLTHRSIVEFKLLD